MKQGAAIRTSQDLRIDGVRRANSVKTKQRLMCGATILDCEQAQDWLAGPATH